MPKRYTNFSPTWKWVQMFETMKKKTNNWHQSKTQAIHCILSFCINHKIFEHSEMSPTLCNEVQDLLTSKGNFWIFDFVRIKLWELRCILQPKRLPCINHVVRCWCNTRVSEVCTWWKCNCVCFVLLDLWFWQHLCFLQHYFGMDLNLGHWVLWIVEFLYLLPNFLSWEQLIYLCFVDLFRSLSTGTLLHWSWWMILGRILQTWTIR